MVLRFGFVFPVHKCAERIKERKETDHVEKNIFYHEPNPYYIYDK